MRRIGILAVFAALSGCGWYTNVPAQLSVLSVEPSTVHVAIEGAKVTFTNPTVTVQGQNGSVGALFTQANVTYGDAVPKKTMYLNLRVEPTYLKKYPSESATTKEVEFTPGSGKVMLPIIDQDVIDAGKTKRSITAAVKLIGLDDARIPSELDVYVPIVFTGQ